VRDLIQPLAPRLRLLRGLLDGETAFTGPAYVNIDVTHRCNLRCASCRWHSPLLEKPLLAPGSGRDFPFELFPRLCRDLSALGTRTMLFVGAGEPLLHPRIFDMIGAARQAGFELVMYSNGTLLQEERVRRLVDSGLDALRVSYWTGGAGTATPGDTPVPPDLPGQPRPDLQREGLEQLAQAKRQANRRAPRVELTHPVGGTELVHLEELIELVRKGWADRLHFSLLLDFNQDDLPKHRFGSGQAGRLADSFRSAGARLDTLGIPHNLGDILGRLRTGPRGWERLPCHSPWFYAFIDSDGRVRSCQRHQDHLGDLGAATFPEIWNGPSYRAFRNRVRQPGGLAAIQDRCWCDFCPHVVNIHRVHRIFRWFHPRRGSPTRP